ncbi:hypothetical protein FB45DRAFT_898813 [Roridomyces roridus]|uniref:Uncharacterized protein n=1 Tax=Roridomyces roridus TaxID=1738132 RepID=A0AAD7CCQ9_9AGAR|nr:hypothetical protein FB45DRAFT_898813 [Roridomyces roridus]
MGFRCHLLAFSLSPQTMAPFWPPPPWSLLLFHLGLIYPEGDSLTSALEASLLPGGLRGLGDSIRISLPSFETPHFPPMSTASLFPGRVPAHVTIFPAFNIQASEYPAMRQRLDAVARMAWTNRGPFVLESCGMRHNDNWVAIRLRDRDFPRRNRFKEIVQLIERMIPGSATDEPHLSVYFRPRHFDPGMSTAELSQRVGSLVDEYSENVRRPLSIQVSGYELLRCGSVIASFSFDSQLKEVHSGMESGHSCLNSFAYGGGNNRTPGYLACA